MNAYATIFSRISLTPEEISVSARSESITTFIDFFVSESTSSYTPNDLESFDAICGLMASIFLIKSV